MKQILVPIILASLTLAGCDNTDENVTDAGAEQAAAPSKVHEIAWHHVEQTSEVDDAFALAAAESKPIFLYWGAIWCPPCQEIKQTVFKSKEFIALTELFVPVYLDGDIPDAQAAGERFGVKGYPTMIVFNPAGEEVTRIPGGIDISRYNSILELSLNSLRPTHDLVVQGMTDPSKLSASDFTQLAYYSWGQDFKALPEDAPEDLFATLADAASPVDPIASSRLYMQYLVDAVGRDSEEEPVRIKGAESRLNDILDSSELVLACWDSLAYWPEVTGILDMDEKAKSDLEAKWASRLMALRSASSLSTAEQLAGWLPKLYYHFDSAGDDESTEPLPDADRIALVADLEAADKATSNAFARQSVINQIRYLYQQAKMVDKAEALLLAELEKSKAPYYFMSSLGSLMEKQDRTDEAVEWYRKSYEASEGAATRFQWGASYVRAIIRLKPDDEKTILDTSEALFSDLSGEDEVFTGRNFRVLRRLNSALDEWKAESTEAQLAERFVSRIQNLCASQPEGSLEKENCESLVQNSAST
jgi:thioredoxin-related protein